VSNERLVIPFSKDEKGGKKRGVDEELILFKGGKGGRPLMASSIRREKALLAVSLFPPST